MASSVVDLILSHRDASIAIVVTCVTVVALAFIYIYSNGNTSSRSPRKHDKINNKLMNQRKTIDKLTNEGNEHRKVIKAREQTIRSLKHDQKKEKEKVKKFNGVRKEDKDKIWSQQKKIREYEEAFCSMIKENQSLRDKNRNLTNKCNRQKRRIERMEGKIKEQSCQLNHINQKFQMTSEKKNEKIKSLRQQLRHKCTKHQEDIESAKKDQEKRNELIKSLKKQVKQLQNNNERVKELEEMLKSRNVTCEICGVLGMFGVFADNHAVHEELRATDSQRDKFDAAGSEVERFPSQVDHETGNQSSSSAALQDVKIKKDSSTRYRDPLVISSENEISLQVVGTVVSTNVIDRGVQTDIVLPEILVDKGDVLRSVEGLSEATLDRIQIQNTLTELSPQFDDISDDKYQKILLSNCDTEYDILAVVAGLCNRYISRN